MMNVFKRGASGSSKRGISAGLRKDETERLWYQLISYSLLSKLSFRLIVDEQLMEICKFQVRPALIVPKHSMNPYLCNPSPSAMRYNRIEKETACRIWTLEIRTIPQSQIVGYSSLQITIPDAGRVGRRFVDQLAESKTVFYGL
jgi:hypothetical protein